MQNLTPEELEYLRQYVYQQGQYGLRPENVNVTGSDGSTYHPTYSGGLVGDDMQDTTTLTGFMKDVNPGQNQVGDMQQMYGTGGQYQGTAAIPKDTATQDLIKFAAMAAAMGYGGSMLNGMGGSSFGVLGDAATATGMGGGSAAAGASAGGGGGLLSGIGDTISGGMKSIGNGISGMFGGGAAGGSAGGGAYDPFFEGPAATMSSAANTGGLFDTAKGWLGPASTLLGAAAGAQGQTKEQTETRKTDPRVDPYLFGSGSTPGLLQYASNLLGQQMAPGGMAGYEQMQKAGMGLLGNPIAGNGFAQFTKGRY